MSKVALFNQMQKDLEALQARMAQIQEAATSELELINLIKSTAAEKNLSLLDIALAIAPQLEKTSGKSGKDVKGEGRTPRRARVLKRYLNPHNSEVVETKGGNHRQLKEWKAKWGADVVEGWLVKAE